MNRYLFFRTDRIGDFLVSAILFKAIKRNDQKSHITIISSRKNYKYIKSFKFVDKTILYPKSFTEKIKLIMNLKKKNYKLICVLDGKKRSIYFSLYLNSKIKILFTTKKIFKIIFNYYYSLVFYFKESKNKLIEMKSVLKFLGYNYKNADMDLFYKKNILNKKQLIVKNKYLIFHFDEKWFSKDYIKSYTSIEPSYEEFRDFIDLISKKTKLNIVITTGSNSKNLILNRFKKNLKKINKNKFFKIIKKKKIYLFSKLDIFDLEYLIKNSDTLITCHGAASHIGSSSNIKIVDIFEKKYFKHYYKWNSHFRNCKYLFREDFSGLSKKLINYI